MKRLSSIRLVVVMLCIFSCMATLMYNICFAQQNNEGMNLLPLSTNPVSGVVIQTTMQRSINWEQKEYSTTEGIKVLMQVVTDAHTDPDKRADALSKLSNFGPWLHNTDNIPELIMAYSLCTDRVEKGRLISCLALSDDRRTLPLLTKYYSEAANDVARAQGAYSLAKWNIRRGVSGLISLLESRELINGRLKLANNVRKTLQRLNLQKGWGIPGKDILLKVNEVGSDVSDDQKMVLYAEEVKKWFAENKHRFPEWKAGDPLPKIEQKDKSD